MFSVALSVHGASTPLPGRYPAHRSVEFGLSSPRLYGLTAGERLQAGSDRPAQQLTVQIIDAQPGTQFPTRRPHCCSQRFLWATISPPIRHIALPSHSSS